jgi:hypothetical protein
MIIVGALSTPPPHKKKEKERERGYTCFTVHYILLSLDHESNLVASIDEAEMEEL